MFYFDTDQMIIYPAEKGGFDRIYGRIHILNSKAGESVIWLFNLVGNPFLQQLHHKILKREKRNSDIPS